MDILVKGLESINTEFLLDLIPDSVKNTGFYNIFKVEFPNTKKHINLIPLFLLFGYQVSVFFHICITASCIREVLYSFCL